MESQPNDLADKISLYVIECSLTIDKDQLREKVVDMKIFSQLKVQSIISSISQVFEISKKIRIFNFYGFEILDDSDLVSYKQSIDCHKIIFYTKSNEFFENKNILRALKIKKKLGEGGFGKVYLAEQKFTHKNFAVKFFRYSSSSIKDLNFLYKEIEVLRKLEQNHIIKLYTYCILEDDKIALILEYAEGGTLKEYLKEKKCLEEEECKEIFKQILESVNYCHQKNIIHRDLKLENVVFTDKLRTFIKIIDFGVSSLFKGEKSKAGSIRYMAPEVITGANTESHPNIDIWSLGCILYELLTGEVLFQGNNEEIKDKITSGKVVTFDKISFEAAHLINAMIKVRPVERIAIKECLEHPWILNQKIESHDEVKKLIPGKRRERLTISTDFQNSGNNTQESDRYHGNNSRTNFSSQIKRSMIRSKTSQKKDLKELPSLLTKIPNDLKESSIYDFNFSLMRQYHGNIPNYLLPIGHNKEQKQKMSKIKTFMKKYFELITPSDKDNRQQESDEISSSSTLKCSSTRQLVKIPRNSPKKKFQTQINTLPTANKLKSSYSSSKSPILDLLKNKKDKEAILSERAKYASNVQVNSSLITKGSNSNLATPKNFQRNSSCAGSEKVTLQNSNGAKKKKKNSPIFHFNSTNKLEGQIVHQINSPAVSTKKHSIPRKK